MRRRRSRQLVKLSVITAVTKNITESLRRLKKSNREINIKKPKDVQMNRFEHLCSEDAVGKQVDLQHKRLATVGQPIGTASRRLFCAEQDDVGRVVVNAARCVLVHVA